MAKAEVAKLASSEFRGRGYVYDGSNLAGYYLSMRFREMGLRPSPGGYTQHFKLAANTFPTPSELVMHGAGKKAGAKPLREGYDYIWSPGSGSAHGKWMVYELDSTHFQPGKRLPPIHTAVPVVRMRGINSPDEVAALHTFTLAHTLHTPVVLLQPAKLTWGVGTQAYTYPVAEVLESAWMPRTRELSLRVQTEEVAYEAMNIVGFLPGLRSDSAMVITAHYDHLGMMGNALFAGASDNATGVAMLLDLARHYSGHPPTFDTWFIAFAGEEAGLVGSKHFTENPRLPLERIRLLVNLDLMGSAAKGIVVVNGSLYPDLMAHLGSANKEQQWVPRIRQRGKAANSDHYWFSEAGVPAIFIYTEGNITAYHDVHDLADGIDWVGYEGVFKLITNLLDTWRQRAN